MSDLYGGWSRYLITPSIGRPMAGYIARQGVARGVEDQLFVRALVLQQDRIRVAIVIADLLLVSNRWAAQLRWRLSRVLRTSPRHILIAATHTHSGPLVDTAPFGFSSSREPTRLREALFQALGNRFELAVRSAMGSMQPVQLAAGRGLIHGVASDRNRPNRAAVQSYTLFHFKGRRSQAFLAIYGCHPTVLGADNLQFSGDLHGEIARQYELHADVALIGNGASANISTRFTRKSQSPTELRRLAAKLMKQACATPIQPVKAPRLAVQATYLRLPVRAPQLPVTIASRLTGRLRVVAEEALEIRRQLRDSVFARKKTLVVPITALMLGDTLLAALPFEVYASTGEFLWKKAQVVPLCYANGYWGYVAAPSAASVDYEVVSSPFSAGADERIRKTILSLRKRF